jgi:hypothetical protein
VIDLSELSGSFRCHETANGQRRIDESSPRGGGVLLGQGEGACIPVPTALFYSLSRARCAVACQRCFSFPECLPCCFFSSRHSLTAPRRASFLLAIVGVSRKLRASVLVVRKNSLLILATTTQRRFNSMWMIWDGSTWPLKSPRCSARPLLSPRKRTRRQRAIHLLKY